MNKTMILSVSIMAIFVIGTISMVPVALAYSGLGAVDGITLEEHLELAERKVQKAADNPATGSGTPYLDAGVVLGPLLFPEAIFGGLPTAFFVRENSGSTPASGRGYFSTSFLFY